MSVLRVFADLGNSRLKWGRPRADGGLEVVSLPLDDPAAWCDAWAAWNPSADPSSWAISTVNPPVADRLGRFLEGQPGASARWFRSAADVPVPHELEGPHTAGTDRAFAVLGAVAAHPGGGPGVVVLCGSAITVERISADGVWQGGAIAPGLRLAAEALHAMSSQLPLVHPDRPPAAWGRSTVPALEAGVFWATVGAIRALVDRQAGGLSPRPWVVWSGGDAELLMGSSVLDLPDARLAPSLVLDGLRVTCEA
jgi:type III pantothenate kinase